MPRRRRFFFSPAWLLAVWIAVSHAQTAPARLEFAAASIKPAAPGARGYSIQPQPGGLRAVNCTLKMLIAEAYHVYDFQVAGGPKWFDSDRFDIDAKTAGGEKASEKDLRSMLQSLLAGRFHLMVQEGDKEMTVFALEGGKDRVKLPANPSPEAPYFRVFQRRQITAQRAPLEYLTEALSQLLGRPVVDETGLEGHFDYKLEWTPDEFQAASAENSVAAGEESAPSITAALREQMGLTMRTKKAPVRVITVASAERPDSN